MVGQLKGGSMPAGAAVLAFFGGGGYLGGGGKGRRPDIPGTAGRARLAPKAGGSCSCCCVPTIPGGSTGNGRGAGKLSNVVLPGTPLTGGGLACSRILSRYISGTPDFVRPSEMKDPESPGHVARRWQHGPQHQT